MAAAKRGVRDGLLLVDLGSREARVLAVVREAAGLRLCGTAIGAFTAARDGVVMQRELARQQLAPLVRDVERQAGVPLRSAMAALGGTHLGLVRASGSLELKLPVSLRESHVEQALESAARIGLPPDQEVLHVLPTRYRVDGATVARLPLGLRARLLVAECALVTASRLALDSLERVFADLDCDLVDVAAEPLVTAGALLGAEDRRRGAALIDIGAERIGAAVYRDHVLQGIACLGVGAAHVSRDLAYALSVDFAFAEALKHRFGVASLKEATPGLETTLELPAGAARVSQVAVAQVVEPRLRELLGLVRDALRQTQALMPGDRIVLGGGGARLRGTAALAEDVFGLPARLASESAAPVPPAASVPPDLSGTALGLLDYASRCAAHGAVHETVWRGAMQHLRHVFRAGGARRAGGAGSRPQAVVEAAAPEGGPVPSGVGVDLEVGDVRVRTRV